MAPQYKLYYFNTMGLAEPIRLTLAYAKVEYQDIRIEKDDWPNHKERIPWGKIPALELSDGQFLSQTSAIIRYLAKKYNLIGGDDLEAAKCDEYAGAIADLQQEFVKVFRAPNEEAKVEIKNKILQESFPKYCENFMTIIRKNGTGYLVGNKLTYADIVLAYVIGQLRKLLDPMLLERYPEMAKFEWFVNSHAGIKDWIEKRPQTLF